MNVLIAVDDTEESMDAAHTAYRLFGEKADYTVTCAEPVGVSSLPPTPSGSMPLFIALDRLVESALDRATATASEAAETLAADADVVPDTGPAGAAICATASDIGADVVVIGSHDKNMWQKLINGSVGRYVVDNAPCPVLVVR